MTEFRYVWNRPDPKAAKKANRVLGDIRAFVGEEFAGELRYGLGPGEGVIGIIEIGTEPPFRRQRCATGLVDELRDGYPGHQFVDAHGDNTCDGNKLMAWLRAEGKIT